MPGIVRARAPGLFLLVAAAHGVVAGAPRRAEAVTQVNGNYFVEDAVATRPGDESNLLQTGINASVVPPTKKNVNAALNFRFNYVRSDEEELANFSPLGNIGLDLNGEAFNLSLARTHYAVVGTTTELIETVLSRAALSVAPKEYPRISASFSRVENTPTSGIATKGENGAVSLDYQYRWAEMRAGYSASRSEAGGSRYDSSTRFAGLRGSYEILPATLVMGDLGISRLESESSAGADSATTTRTALMNAETRPFSWLRLAGAYTRNASAVSSPTSVLPSTTERTVDGGVTLIPYPSLHFGANVGNRRFNDLQGVHNVDYRTFSARFAQQLELRERILVGANVARSFESDPRQGNNIRDTFGVDAAGDLVPRVSLRLGMSVSRSENRTFVSLPQGFNASGTLADRDRLDRDAGGLPAGFTFFDVANNDLYTKNSAAIGDWSLPVHFDPVVRRYGVGRTMQITAAVTDRLNATLGYTSSASSDDLVLWEIGSQTLNGSLAYLATRRASFGVSGTASLPDRGHETYAGTGTFAYRLVRGHQLNVTYRRQFTGTRQTDAFGASLSVRLAKRLSVDVYYSMTEVFRDDGTQFVRGRLTSSF